MSGKKLSLPRKQSSMFPFVSNEKNRSSLSNSNRNAEANRKNSWKLDLDAFLETKSRSLGWTAEGARPAEEECVGVGRAERSPQESCESETSEAVGGLPTKRTRVHSHTHSDGNHSLSNDDVDEDWRNYSMDSGSAGEALSPNKSLGISSLSRHNNTSTPKGCSANDKQKTKKKKLKPMKLDKSLNEWIEDVSRDSRADPPRQGVYSGGSAAVDKSLKFCKVAYLEILEKTVYAFDCIPLSILDKFPGFDSATYTKLKALRQALKDTIKSQNSLLSKNTISEASPKESASASAVIRLSSDLSQEAGDTSSGRLRLDLDSEEDFQEFEPSKRLSQVSFAKRHCHDTGEHQNEKIYYGHAEGSGGEGTSSKVDPVAESSHSTKREAVTASERQRGKFVFKQPSRLGCTSSHSLSHSLSTPLPSSTLDRVKHVSDNLKPLPFPETPNEGQTKTNAPLNSSAQFQTPHIDPAMLASKPCAMVVPLNVQDPASGSLASGSGNQSVNSASHQDLPTASDGQQNINLQMAESIFSSQLQVDDDGWPEYRIEDFEDVTDATPLDIPELPSHANSPTSTASTSSDRTRVSLGNFHSNVRNDGITGEFDGRSYPHTLELMHQFQEKFGLKSFRPNQLQVINATLTGHDCFVLMPTGGGKSLCYQLPAVLTPGVTIVISPLKSLILDQVFKLNSLDIPAAHMSGEMSLKQLDHVYRQLSLKEPAIKLLYVTPEKISASQKFQGILDSLYARDKLARFVIDEAHCVSQWGHDFRPDYKRLSVLRARFPRVPTMALTATANPRVRVDILHQLSIERCKWFLCSFNRPNLKYIVMPKKGSSVAKDIEVLIKSKFKSDSGIVYCLSRKECDTLATTLESCGISAGSYHAGLTDAQREKVQNNWLNDRFKVVCATIAFGMGIDKADVRFVIHHSLPKSVEGYYQEAGRAGRDGERATCILYYSYTDVMRYRKLLDLDTSGNYEAKKIHIANLMRMVEFCENVTECRRAQVLAYFAETFTREQCRALPTTACDNCLREEDYKVVDATEDCKMLCRCVKDLCSGRNRFTLLHIAEVFKGSAQKKIMENKHNLHPAYGRGKHWPKGDIQRLLHQLITKEFLMEELIVSNNIANAFVRVGPRVHRLMNDACSVMFPMRSDKKTLKMVSAGGAINSDNSPLAVELKKTQEQCYSALLETVREIAREKNITIASVMNLNGLKAMAEVLPESPEEMLALPHVTKANFDKFGKELLEVTIRYSAQKLCILAEMEESKIQAGCSGGVTCESHTDWESAAASAGASGRQAGKRRGGRVVGNKAKRFRRGKSGSKYSPKKSQRHRTRGGGVKRGRKRGGGAANPRSTSGSGAQPGYLGFMPMPKFGT